MLYKQSYIPKWTFICEKFPEKNDMLELFWGDNRDRFWQNLANNDQTKNISREEIFHHTNVLIAVTKKNTNYLCPGKISGKCKSFWKISNISVGAS